MTAPNPAAAATHGWPCVINNADGVPELRVRHNRIPPSPKQNAFLQLTNDEALYGGAAGGGKSLALMQAAAQFVDVPGYNAILLRRTLKDLKGADSLIPMSKWMFGGVPGATYNNSENVWRFETNGEPAHIRFGYLRHPGDELQYQGHQFQFVGFDELTQFPDEAQYEYLFSRLRRPSLPREHMVALYGQSDDGLTLADIVLRMRAATNPGGPGMYWVKPRFVDEVTRKAPFLPSTMLDNPGIDAEEYRATLAHLSPVERRRLEFGDWEVVEVPGALWKFADMTRVEELPEFDIVCVAVDPSVSEGTGDECGIVIGGMVDGVITVIEDASLQAHPDDWAKRAVIKYHEHGASRMVIEENQGGAMNRITVHNAADVLGVGRPNVALVRANPGESKEVRAQPVAQAYRATKVVHGPEVRDSPLEAQMTSWIPGDRLSARGSPDRVDALVWLVQHLLFKKGSPVQSRTSARERMAGRL